jgi:hypothetical protein
LLNHAQKELYRDVMLETIWNLASIGEGDVDAALSHLVHKYFLFTSVFPIFKMLRGSKQTWVVTVIYDHENLHIKQIFLLSWFKRPEALWSH